MNETAIVKFLAEQIGGVTFLSPNDETGDKYWQFKTPNGKTPYTCIQVADYDPMNDISHAFMVVEWMIKNSSAWSINIIWEPHEEDKQDWYGEIFTDINSQGVVSQSSETAPEAITLAAARARATDAQVKGWGLK